MITFEKDNHGRLIVLDTKMNGENLVLQTNISQQVQFFEKVMNKLSNYADENIIIGGDFNCPLTESDKIGGKSVENKKRVRDKISQLSDLYSLQEVWRELNPEKKQLTWRDKAYKVQCRLDYFLASQILLTLLKSVVLSTHQGQITVRSNYLFSQTLSTKRLGRDFGNLTRRY